MLKKPIKLKRELNLFSLTIAGVGIILGAGIYALIGVAAGTTGPSIWLSFLIAAIVAAFTGLSYAELSTIFHSDASEYDYGETAFNPKIGLFIGLLLIFSEIVSAATVSLGFAGYFSALINSPIVITAIAIIIVTSLINFYGIKESSSINIIATIIEALGLLVIITLGIKHLGSINLLEMPHGFTGLLSGASLVFFAFIGFEAIVKLSEETKDPDRNVPRALILSLIISTMLYVLVAIAAVSILDWQTLASSGSPLADVAAASVGNVAFLIIAIIALFSTFNTVLMMLVTDARLVYGMAKEKGLPGFLAKVHEKTRTPYIAILVLMMVTILFALIGKIDTVAYITNASIFITFAMVNLSLIVLRYKKPDLKRKFTVPLNIGKFPVLALFGFLSSLLLLYYSLQSVISAIF